MVHEDLPLLALMRLLSTFVAGHRQLDHELADNKSKNGKLSATSPPFNVKEATALSGSDVDDICYRTAR